MCEYCDKKSLKNDNLVPVVDDVFLLFGDTLMEVCTALGMNEEGVIEEEIYLSNFCVARQKVNYCPMCGASLN